MSRHMNRRDRTINTDRWRIRQRSLLEGGREVLSMVGGYYYEEGPALAAYQDRVAHYEDGCVQYVHGRPVFEPILPDRVLIQLEVRRGGEQRFNVFLRFEPHG